MMLRRVLASFGLVLALVIGMATSAHAQYDEEAPAGLQQEPAGAQPAGAAQPANLARTGSDFDEWIRVGVVLVTAGAFLTLAARKRGAVVREAV